MVELAAQPRRRLPFQLAVLRLGHRRMWKRHHRGATIEVRDLEPPPSPFRTTCSPTARAGLPGHLRLGQLHPDLRLALGHRDFLVDSECEGSRVLQR